MGVYNYFKSLKKSEIIFRKIFFSGKIYQALCVLFSSC